jgi:hypothetical protein
MNVNKRMLTASLVGVILGLALATIVQTTYAITDANRGGQDGQAQANYDFRTTHQFNDRCNIDESHDYCFHFKISYRLEWTQLEFLH